MHLNKSPLVVFTILFISLLITFFLSDYACEPIEKLETTIYRKLTGKFAQHFEYDSLGVPFVVYQGNIGKQYNIVSVAEYAIKLHKKSITQEDTVFNNCIEWLIRHSSRLNDSSLIYLNFYDWPGYSMKSPWRSAMNQGRVMQAFLLAYEDTSEDLFLDYARQSMNALFTEVKDGGVTYIDETGYWFEEYADDNLYESRVLNGMIVVLEALSDFYVVTDDTAARFLFSEGTKALKSTLHQYDNEGHSNYDILGKPASPWYHKFHIAQLEDLYKKTDEPVFDQYRLKWSQYKEPSYLKALAQKPRNIGIAAAITLYLMTVLIMAILVSFFMRTGKMEVDYRIKNSGSSFKKKLND
jgi:hypothetical protein